MKVEMISDIANGRQGLFPFYPKGVNALKRIPIGEVKIVDIKSERFYPHLQKYWATCNLVALNNKAFEGLDEMDHRDKVDEYVKLKTHHVDYRIVINDRVHIRTKSIGYDTLDQEEFQNYFDKAIKELSWMSGISEHNLLENWDDYLIQ